MRFEKTGKVIDGFYVIGSNAVPVYMLDGPEPALFDSGYTALAGLYEKDIKDILGDRKPAYLFLTHTHFDHVGSAGYFKTLWPDLKIIGSSKSREILAKPNVIKSIQDLNLEGGRTMQAMGIAPTHERPFNTFEIDIVMEHEDRMTLGPDISVRAIHSPGHTWDFMCYWIPEKKILIASDALGGGKVKPDFLADYDIFIDSLTRLAAVDADIVCPGHSVVLTGSDIEDYIHSVFEAAKKYLPMVASFLIEEKGDIDRVTTRIKTAQWDPLPYPKQPEKAYLVSTRQRVKKIQERIEKNPINVHSK